MGSERLRINVCGRTELAGNHVDHQGGKVVCASVDRSIEMLVAPNDSFTVNLTSQHFQDITVDLSRLEPESHERGTSKALVKGMAAAAREQGWELKGFDAQMTSTIPIGGGLSSSAAFEVAIGAAFAALSKDTASAELSQERLLQIAAMGQCAENDYFGKPCGMMDQAACALGGVIGLDFSAGRLPAVEHIASQLPWDDLALCMVDCGESHANAIGDYATIPSDMRTVAQALGCQLLSEVDPQKFWQQIPRLRQCCGDRATLRAMHYFDEMDYVDMRIDALKAADKDRFLELTRLSGQSSAQQLQNVSVSGSESQPAMVALALCQKALGSNGAARIHGGGFGGSIQAFVPCDMVGSFSDAINGYLGFESVSVLSITSQGVIAEWL